MIVDDKNELVSESSTNNLSDGGFLTNLGPKRTRANTDHEDFNQTAEKKFKKFCNFTNLYKAAVKSPQIEKNEGLDTSFQKDLNQNNQKLFLMSKMSTTTEVDLELEQKYSNLLDKEEDISAEFKELNDEITNYALKDLKNESNKKLIENNDDIENSNMDNELKNAQEEFNTVFLEKQNSRSRYLSL
jgi:hypothetical protein